MVFRRKKYKILLKSPIFLFSECREEQFQLERESYSPALVVNVHFHYSFPFLHSQIQMTMNTQKYPTMI